VEPGVVRRVTRLPALHRTRNRAIIDPGRNRGDWFR